MSDGNRSLLPTLSLNTATRQLGFIKGPYITNEHVEYMKSEGFELDGKYYTKHIEDIKYSEVQITITSKGIAVICNPLVNPTPKFILTFVHFGNFSNCYDEMVKRLKELLN